jgi:hypothetical protein
MKKFDTIFRISAKLILAMVMIQSTCFAQEDSIRKENNRPAKPAFESGYLIDQQTSVIPGKNTLEFAIHHRFGAMNNGVHDLFGIYSSSNIRFGLNFSFTDNLVIGIGTTKNKKYQDFTLKYNILKQTRSLSIPVSVTFFESFAIDASNKTVFGTEYKFSNRLSYFSQLIITHRVNNMISLQLAPSFTHYNSTDSLFDHDKIGLSFGGRVKITPQTSIICAVDMPMYFKGIREYPEPDHLSKPNLSLGVEISTSTHAFQIFVATAQGILPQENMMWNNLESGKKPSTANLFLGFNITRLWNF